MQIDGTVGLSVVIIVCSGARPWPVLLRSQLSHYSGPCRPALTCEAANPGQPGRARASPVRNALEKKPHGEADVLFSLRGVQLISRHDDARGATYHEAQKRSRRAFRFGHLDFSLSAVTHEQITEKADIG